MKLWEDWILLRRGKQAGAAHFLGVRPCGPKKGCALSETISAGPLRPLPSPLRA